MKNELLTIGPFTVYGYGLMIAIGIFAAYIDLVMPSVALAQGFGRIGCFL